MIVLYKRIILNYNITAQNNRESILNQNYIQHILGTLHRLINAHK